MHRILIINGHPDKASFNQALANAYVQGAQATTANITQINLYELDFDPNLNFGYRKRTPLEPDLLHAIEAIQQATHVVWVFPVWWYGYPALMKGFIDRVFLPGIAFEYEAGKALPKRLWRGKSARLIITADTPQWYHRLVYKQPVINQFKKGTLQFCGFSPVKVSYFAPIKDSKLAQREKWLQEVQLLGEKLK